MKRNILIFMLGIALLAVSQYTWKFQIEKWMFIFSITVYLIGGLVIKKKIEAFLLILPITALHIFGIFANSKLVPLMIPTLTFCVYLAVYTGTLLRNSKWRIGLPIILFMAVFSIYVIPRWEFSRNITESTGVELLIDNLELINQSHEYFDTDQLNGKIVIVDLWFNKCSQCYRLFDELILLKKAIEQDPVLKDLVKVVCVNDGKIDSFEAFLQNERLKNYANDFVYSKNNLYSGNVEIEGYPVLLIFDTDRKLYRSIHGMFKGHPGFYHKRVMDILQEMAI